MARRRWESWERRRGVGRRGGEEERGAGDVNTDIDHFSFCISVL